MASNPMQKKARTSFLLGVLVTVIILGAVIGFLLYQIYSQKKKEETIENSKVDVYVLNKDFSAGESINIASLRIENVESTLAPKSAITLANYAQFVKENTVTKVKLDSGTILTADLIVDQDEVAKNDIREEELNMVVLPTYLTKNDYIDIRLSLPTGENYIVISKKKVKDTNEKTVWLDLSEAETLTLSNAIVEAYQVSGSKLYANRYIEPGIQETAETTYVPSNSVLNLISSNGNIVEEAKNALAARYSKYLSTRNAITSALNASAEEAKENISNGVETSIGTQEQQRADYITELKSKK